MDQANRHSTHDVDPTFLKRWSPRAFKDEVVPDSVLLSAFEAARWAPSGGNTQPWRFMYAKKGAPTWPLFLEFLVEGNRSWAKDSSALVILVAKKDYVWNGQTADSSSYSLDAGAAWMSFALQLSKLGWFTHAMAGFDQEKVRKDFEIPANFCIEVMIAVGKIGAKESLPPKLQEREKPSDRQPLESLIHQGGFKPEWRN